MPDQSKKKLILGLSFIIVSFLCIAAFFYLFGQNSRDDAARMASLEVQLANLMIEKSQSQLSPDDARRVAREPISLEEFTEKAENIYGKAELSRKEGILWIDRASSKFMVTLGAVNGLKAESKLGIYQDDKKIGEVVVETPMDIISYVRLPGPSAAQWDRNYYRAVIE
jgi:hypothetical protein